MIPFKPKRALISLSNKKGILEVAKNLIQQDVEIIATNSTALYLQKEGITITEVSEYTGFPEILDGRVKTLHPSIFAGILARGEQDETILNQYKIKPFDLIIVNLYPFKEIIQEKDCQFNTAIENIDIGGPSLIRAAAKNHAYTTIIVDGSDYEPLKEYLEKQQSPKDWSLQLAKKAFLYTADYEQSIAHYFQELSQEKTLPKFKNYEQAIELRYGENPHQKAFLYREKKGQNSLANAKLIQGKALSYNNLLDADAAFGAIKAFASEKPTCIIVKHGNPCGIASRDSQKEAYLRAFATDPISSFGGILAFNQQIESDTAKTLIDKQFCEVIIAPGIDDDAKLILAARKNIRILITGTLNKPEPIDWQFRSINGGLLVQEKDNLKPNPALFKIVSDIKPSFDLNADILFASRAIKDIKSNAILLVKHEASLGIGAGQTSRITSTELALKLAKQFDHDIKDSILVSDAFIPFADSLEMAASAGVKMIIQPGGSINDEVIIKRANQLGLIMIFTGTRHFKH